jgi:nicotinate-nucleotide--dimethylbenzimidazole phosphoribosyltransferase
MCADNGIVEEGVTQSGQDVTEAVAAWMGRGESSVCKMAANAKADVIPIDIGINMEGSPEGVLNRKIRMGTANFLKEPAMTGDELERAIETGIELVRDCKDKGYAMIATGEMGIGNTTTSSAVCAALLNLPPDKVTGRGAGLGDAGLSRKIEVIRQALDFHGIINSADEILHVSNVEKKDKVKEGNRSRDFAIMVLSIVGGLDIAGLTGVFIGGALYNIPIVIDGFISAVAGLAAERLLPGTREVMIPSHLGREEGMKYVLKELDLEPVIDGNMALGEGTGAVMLFPLLDTALALYRGGLKFEETEVAQYKNHGA